MLIYSSCITYSNSDFEKLEMSWGVDIEPAYTMVNVAFGL
jgi:hypothetical protein